MLLKQALEQNLRFYCLCFSVPDHWTQITFASHQESNGIPVQRDCYAANVLTKPLLANFLPLENGHPVLLESDRAVEQGLQSRHHFQVADDP